MNENDSALDGSALSQCSQLLLQVARLSLTPYMPSDRLALHVFPFLSRLQIILNYKQQSQQQQ